MTASTFEGGAIHEPTPEAREWHVLRPDRWGVLERAAANVKKADTFTASWVSGCLAFAGASLLGFLTVLLTISSHRHPHTSALQLLGGVTVASLVLAYMVYRIEKRSKKDRTDAVDNLITEMKACKKLMGLKDAGDSLPSETTEELVVSMPNERASLR